MIKHFQSRRLNIFSFYDCLCFHVYFSMCGSRITCTKDIKHLMLYRDLIYFPPNMPGLATVVSVFVQCCPGWIYSRISYIPFQHRKEETGTCARDIYFV